LAGGQMFVYVLTGYIKMTIQRSKRETRKTHPLPTGEFSTAQSQLCRL